MTDKRCPGLVSALCLWHLTALSLVESLLLPITMRSIVWHLKGIPSVFKVHFANRIQWPALSPGSVWLIGYVPDIPESWMWVIPWRFWWAWRDQGQLNHKDLLLLARCLAQIFIFNHLKKSGWISRYSQSEGQCAGRERILWRVTWSGPFFF